MKTRRANNIHSRYAADLSEFCGVAAAAAGHGINQSASSGRMELRNVNTGALD